MTTPSQVLTIYKWHVIISSVLDASLLSSVKCILLSRSTILRQWKMSEILVDLAFLPKTCARCNPPKTDMKPEHLITGKGELQGQKTPLSGPKLGIPIDASNARELIWAWLMQHARRLKRIVRECDTTWLKGRNWRSLFTYSYFASKVGKCALWVLDVWCFSRFPRENRGEKVKWRWFFGLNTEAYRSKQIFDIWTEVWSGQRNRLKYVISTQAAPWRFKGRWNHCERSVTQKVEAIFVVLPHVAVNSQNTPTCLRYGLMSPMTCSHRTMVVEQIS